MSSIGRFFKATSGDSELFRERLEKRFPGERFTLLELPYAAREGIFCFEIHVGSEACPDEIRAFVDEYIATHAQANSSGEPELPG